MASCNERVLGMLCCAWREVSNAKDLDLGFSVLTMASAGDCEGEPSSKEGGGPCSFVGAFCFGFDSLCGCFWLLWYSLGFV